MSPQNPAQSMRQLRAVSPGEQIRSPHVGGQSLEQFDAFSKLALQNPSPQNPGQSPGQLVVDSVAPQMPSPQ